MLLQIKNTLKFILGINTSQEQTNERLEYLYPEKISYSQSGEDLIVNYIFNARNVSNFTFLDIGANHPTYINNTYLFYLNGSRGVNVEPNPTMIKRFKILRPEDISLEAGASENEGELMYYQMDANELNTFSKEQAIYLQQKGFKIVNEKLIPVMNINSIIRIHFNDKCPNVIFIDAEGMDLELVKSIDFDLYKPEVICVESVSFDLKGRGKKDNELIDYVISKGYLLYADTNINSIFVKESFWCV